MTATRQDLTIVKGSTFSKVLRWSTTPYIYKAITAITKAAPVQITAAGHGIQTGFPVAVVSAGGMREINAKLLGKGKPPMLSEFKTATRVTDDVITINEVNSAEFTTYTSGGYLVYLTPVDLSGYSARMMIRSTEDATGDPLVSLVSPTNIVLDNTAKTITITIAATATDDYTFLTGEYDLELVSGDATPVVTKLLEGTITVESETTR